MVVNKKIKKFIKQNKLNRQFIKFARKYYPCAICGNTENLQFHHCKKLYKKEMSINKIVRKKYKILDILNEMNKCTIICEDCHKNIHNNGHKDKTEPIEWINVYCEFLKGCGMDEQ